MDSKSRLDNKSRSTLMQIAICLVANMPTMPAGMTIGFSAVTNPFMTKPNPTLFITGQQASFVASCVSLAVPVGALLAGAVMEGLGRRAVLVFSCLPSTLGWLAMAAFPTYEGVVVGRLLTGFATGFCCNSATVFTAESSTPALRGFLINGTNLGFSSGILTVYLLGLIFKDNWRLIAMICSSVPIIAVLCLLRWMPESPVWLVSKGRSVQALKSLARLRADNYRSPSITAELREMTKNADNSEQELTFKRILQAFLRPEAYKPLAVMLTFFLFQQVSGTFVILFYGVTVVKEAGVATDPFVITVLVGITNVVFTFVGAWSSRTFGRRPCAITSGLGITTALFLLSLYLHYSPAQTQHMAQLDNRTLSTLSTSLASTDPLSTSTVENASTSYSWIPVSAILLFIMSSTVGFLSLPWAMLGEVFPAVIRGAACGICTCIAYLMNFLIILAFPTMLSYLGNKGIFTFYGSVSLLGTVFLAVYLPETQNKTLAEIETYFAGKRRRIGPQEKESLKTSGKA